MCLFWQCGAKPRKLQPQHAKCASAGCANHSARTKRSATAKAARAATARLRTNSLRHFRTRTRTICVTFLPQVGRHPQRRATRVGCVYLGARDLRPPSHQSAASGMPGLAWCVEMHHEGDAGQVLLNHIQALARLKPGCHCVRSK